jgi:hypothetical protein
MTVRQVRNESRGRMKTTGMGRWEGVVLGMPRVQKGSQGGNFSNRRCSKCSLDSSHVRRFSTAAGDAKAATWATLDVSVSSSDLHGDLDFSHFSNWEFASVFDVYELAACCAGTTDTDGLHRLPDWLHHDVESPLRDDDGGAVVLRICDWSWRDLFCDVLWNVFVFDEIISVLPPFPAVPPAISCVCLCFTLCMPPLLAVVAGGGSALVRRYHFYGNGALALTFIWATVLGVLIV